MFMVLFVVLFVVLSVIIDNFGTVYDAGQFEDQERNRQQHGEAKAC